MDKIELIAVLAGAVLVLAAILVVVVFPSLGGDPAKSTNPPGVGGD